MSVILQISLALLYLTALIFLFIRIDKKNNRLVPPHWIGVAFFVKVMAAFAYGYVYAHYLPVSDSWTLFEASLKEYDTLLNQPSAFFSTGVSFRNFNDFFSNASDATWNNTDDSLFIKIVGLLNLLSGGNYYLTALLFSFFSFWGLYQIFAVSARHYPGSIVPAFILLFFMPSCLFWNSGLHKDGLIVFFTGIAIGAADKLIRRKKTIVPAAIIALSLLLLFLFRTLNTLLLVPALTAWIISSRIRSKAAFIYMAVYLAAIIAFFLTNYLPDIYNLPLKLAEKQHDFMTIEANSRLPLIPLEPGFFSYLRVLPQALNHIFLRPYITEITGPLQWLAFFETNTVILLITWLFFRHYRSLRLITSSPFLLFLLAFSLSNLVVIGLTVPFTGGIVRYKSLYIMLLLLAFILPVQAKQIKLCKNLI